MSRIYAKQEKISPGNDRKCFPCTFCFPSTSGKISKLTFSCLIKMAINQGLVI